MSDPSIKPEKITRPIQLLGAWLAGLFSIDSCFLVAAANLTDGSWESRALVIAAIVNVPIFLTAVFLLQTKFRPELQEDSYYSTYLSRKNNELIRVSKYEAFVFEINHRLENLETRTLGAIEHPELNEGSLDALLFGVNRHLPDLEAIKSRLADLGLSKMSIFGPNEPPEHRVVSISQYLRKKKVDTIVDLASELGFESYNLFDSWAEETEEDVLFGSYGDPGYEILRKNA